jgi:hypothetical protein
MADSSNLTKGLVNEKQQSEEDDNNSVDKGGKESLWGLSVGDKKTPPNTTWEYFTENDFFISQPWNISYYWTVRGSENFHIYLWIAKDLAWSQSWYWPAMVFGSLALAWCFVLLHHAVAARNFEEVYMWVALTLWLAANFVWMAGEVFNNDDDFVVPRAAHIMEAAIAWILFFHIFLKPFGVFQDYDYVNSTYHRPGLKSRFSYFRNWRQYENAHTLCWLGKDLSWNRQSAAPWIICLIPTVLIAADFIFITSHPKNRMMDDAVHYFSQLMWVIGNMLWAMGNIFVYADSDDNPRFIFKMYPTNAHLRWAASWTLFAAFWPIIALYCVWLPLTFSGHFQKKEQREKLTEKEKQFRAQETGAAKPEANSNSSTVNNVLHVPTQ